MSTSVFLGRQPIFDRKRRTYAYELLYRDGTENLAFFRDPDDATRRVLEVAMLEWGFDRVVGDRYGFINAASGILHSGILDILPADRAVIELEEQMVLRRSGARCHPRCARTRSALRPRRRRERRPSGLRRRRTVHQRREDRPPGDRVRLAGGRGRRRPQGCSRRRSDSPRRSRSTPSSHWPDSLGFDLFQGYFFAKPEVMGRTERPANLTAAVQLMGEVNRPEVDLDRVER